jgi:hypothetical protein
MTYKVVDNFLPEDEFKKLYELLDSAIFPWYTESTGIAYLGDTSDKYFVHLFYKDGAPNSDYFYALAPLLNVIQPKALIRAKANMYIRNTNLIEHGQHTDFEYEHNAFIFYLNTNNGYTRMSDGTVVDSIANRGVFFNGESLHNSTNCTDALFRMNLSINYF